MLRTPLSSASGRMLAALVLAFALFSVPQPAFAEKTLGLSASRFDFEAEAGQIGKGSVWVTNEGDEPTLVRVYASDQIIDDTGRPTYVTPSLDTNVLDSPASWMTVLLPEGAKSSGNIPYVSLEPGQRLQVDFDVKVPDGATPGDHQSVLFFEMFQQRDEAQSGSTRVDARLGARVRTRVKGEIVESLEVAPFRVPEYVIGSSVPYRFTVTNKGNVDQQVSVKLSEFDSSDAEISSTEVLKSTPVYARAQLQKSGRVKAGGRGIGPARLRLVLSHPSQVAGANGLIKTVEEERVVWLIPASLLYGALAVLLAIAVYAIWVSGRRFAERKARDVQAEATRIALQDE